MNPDLRALADEYWEYTLESQPTNAHMLGDYRYMDRMEDVSRAGEDADIAQQRSFAARAEAFDPETLDPADRITRDTLIYEAGTSAGVSEMRPAQFAISPIFAPHVVFPLPIPHISFHTPEHAERMLDKYSAIAQTLDQGTERLREGIAAGRVNAKFAVASTVSQIDDLLDTPVEDDVFLKAQMPSAYSDEDAAAWREGAAKIVEDEIRPAFVCWPSARPSRPKASKRPSMPAFACWGKTTFRRPAKRLLRMPQPADCPTMESD